MYKKNTYAKRRLPGWVERRDYFRRVFESMRVKPVREETTLEIAPLAGSAERR